LSTLKYQKLTRLPPLFVRAPSCMEGYEE